jgi:uncharacterized protein DUF481
MTLRIQKCLRRGASALSISVGFIALVASAPAHAQKDPKFDFGKQEEVKAVEWKAQAKGGFAMTSGNSQTTNGTLAANVSRKEGNNKLALEGGLSYGRSSVLRAQPNATNPLMYDLQRQSVTSTNNYYGKGRYDRFFTANNAGYASGQAAADKIAGKTFFGGGQIGYSRQVYKSEMHLLVAEAGYDFSYERYVQVPTKTLDPVSIHSARIFVGETLKLSAATGISASIEALLNLNKEGAATSVSTKNPGVDAFKDTRVNGKIALTTTLYKQLSIGFGFTVKYDQNPAVLPNPSNAGTLTPSDTFFAEKVDTLTELTLIMTFL